MTNTQVRSSFGRLYDYADLANMPTPSINEIVEHLATEQRFGGACKGYDLYSIAQHGVGTSLLAEQISQGDPIVALYALHHDDHEFLLKDAMTPLKNYVKMRTKIDVYGELSDQIDNVIFTEVLNLPHPMPDWIKVIVDEADYRMYVTEGLALVRGFEPPEGIIPAPFNITPMMPEQAAKAYLLRHEKLVKRRGSRVI